MRTFAVVAFLTCMFLLLPAPLSAEEASATPAKEEVEAPSPAPSASPVQGEKVMVRLERGVIIRGVVRHRAEVMVGSGFRPVEGREVPGAGVRIFYARGLDGYLFLPYESIVEIRFPGKLSDGEGRELAKQLDEGREKAAEDRARAFAEIMAKKAAKELGDAEALGDGEEPLAAEAAEESGGAGESTKPEEAKRPEQPEEPAVKPPTPEELEREKKILALLEEFPPPKWEPERLEDVKRDLLMELEPTEAEQKFVENYELWLVGYRRWAKEQAKTGEDATE
jgi:hypothetical protein